MCLEVGSKPQEAIAYCQKATSACKARLDRLTNEVKGSLQSISSSASELDHDVEIGTKPESDNSIVEKQAEIETLTDLSSELEKKVVSINFLRYLICYYIVISLSIWDSLNCSLKIYNSWS